MTNLDCNSQSRSYDDILPQCYRVRHWRNASSTAICDDFKRDRGSLWRTLQVDLRQFLANVRWRLPSAGSTSITLRLELEVRESKEVVLSCQFVFFQVWPQCGDSLAASFPGVNNLEIFFFCSALVPLQGPLFWYGEAGFRD